MSKIVCEVCGTAYPETASQCPICGSARTDNAGTSGDIASQDGGYAYLKGGRFSHANVRKRNNGQAEPPRTVVPARSLNEAPAPKTTEPEPEAQDQTQDQTQNQSNEQTQQDPAPEKQDTVEKVAPAPMNLPRRRKPQKKDDLSSNKGLVIIVALLIIAILAVCVFIAVRLIDMNSEPTVPGGSPTTTLSIPTTSSTVNKPERIPCTGIRLPYPSKTFTSVGEIAMLSVDKQPKDTTDPVYFESSDPYIASVNDEGVIVAVANGTVDITVRCGDFTAVCEIICNVGVDPSYPTEPPATSTVPTAPPVTIPPAPSTNPSEPFVKLELNRLDFTLTGYGSTHNLYSGELDPASITWTSTNEKVATVENGIVTAVGNGKAEIIAEYRGQRVTCIVRCAKAEKPGFELSHTDITIRVGSKFTLMAYVENEDGTKTRIDPSELKFTPTNYAKDHFTVDENGEITGIKNNINYYEVYKTLYVEYKGETLKCIVRISG